MINRKENIHYSKLKVIKVKITMIIIIILIMIIMMIIIMLIIFKIIMIIVIEMIIKINVKCNNICQKQWHVNKFVIKGPSIKKMACTICKGFNYGFSTKNVAL